MIGKKCFSHLETTQRLRKEAVPGHERFPGDGRAAGMLFLAGELHRQTHAADRRELKTSWKCNRGGSATGRDQGALWGAKVNTECLAGTKGETPVHQQAHLALPGWGCSGDGLPVRARAPLAPGLGAVVERGQLS